MDSYLSFLPIFLSSNLITQTYGIGYQCCGFFQMDVRGSVFIEGGRPLPRGEYRALQFRSCNRTPFAVQLWQCLASFTDCTLKWQKFIEPSLNDSVVVNIDPVLTLDPSYRLGLFAPRTDTPADVQLPIPYGVESPLTFLLETMETFHSFDELQAEQKVTLRSSTWTRSFAKSLVFCKSRDCSDLPPNSLAPAMPEDDNQLPLGQCCVQNSKCQASINSGIDENEAEINHLEGVVDILEKEVEKLRPGGSLPPRCPRGFVPGEYGLESCYKIFRKNVSMSEAALTCRDSSESKLVQIDTDTENRFLSDFTIRSGGSAFEESFWIAAIYVQSLNDWFWADEMLDSKDPIAYTNWEGRSAPVANDNNESCSSLTVRQDTNYWNKASCTSRLYFICEARKECD